MSEQNARKIHKTGVRKLLGILLGPLGTVRFPVVWVIPDAWSQSSELTKVYIPGSSWNYALVLFTYDLPTAF
jgi:hypothetical protein